MPPVQESSVHVGQSPPSSHAVPAVGKQETASGLGQANRHHKFATVLAGRARDAEESAGRAAQLSGLSLSTAGSREGLPAPKLAISAARPALSLEGHQRLLVTNTAGHDSAWLRLEGGRFAGTEIHLSIIGTHVEVHVLTPHEASRQTLAIAMEAVRNRLRARGLTMVDVPSPPTVRQRNRGDGRAMDSGSGDGDDCSAV